MGAPIPAIEIADYAHALRIRRPHGEAHALNAQQFHRLRAEHAVALIQTAFAEQIEIVLADGVGKAIGVKSLAREVRVFYF